MSYHRLLYVWLFVWLYVGWMSDGAEEQGEMSLQVNERKPRRGMTVTQVRRGANQQ